ncbi:hypothetical protein [Nostoc parmelioides]|nr:hypothetical protein [Nostoc parmelioides]
MALSQQTILHSRELEVYLAKENDCVVRDAINRVCTVVRCW